MARIDFATFHLRRSGASSFAVVDHVTGRAVSYGAAELVALLTPAQRAALTDVLIALHADAEIKVKAQLDAERAALDIP